MLALKVNVLWKTCVILDLLNQPYEQEQEQETEETQSFVQCVFMLLSYLVMPQHDLVLLLLLKTQKKPL